MQRSILRPLGLALMVTLLAASCATRPAPATQAQAAQPAAAQAAAPAATPAATPAAPAEEKPVTWDPAVWVAFQKEVPRFVQALAKEKIEEMARENGSYFVDQALYEKAMAEYRK
jgi:hypothetical protein